MLLYRRPMVWMSRMGLWVSLLHTRVVMHCIVLVGLPGLLTNILGASMVSVLCRKCGICMLQAQCRVWIPYIEV